MSQNDQTNYEVIETDWGRFVNVGQVSITDDDIENYLQINPKTISDENLQKLGEILFELIQEDYADSLKKAYVVLETENNNAKVI
jgi:hypothetical protein